MERKKGRKRFQRERYLREEVGNEGCVPFHGSKMEKKRDCKGRDSCEKSVIIRKPTSPLMPIGKKNRKKKRKSLKRKEG